MAVTHLSERSALVQRDMVKTVARFRPEKARTLATFKEGTRKKQAGLAGLQISYWKDHAHGQTWYSPVAGDTSFKKSIKQNSGAMYAGVAFRNMNMYMEDHIMLDMQRGLIPDSYIQERKRRIETHMMKKNWAAIGDGRGGVGVVASASGSTLTATKDNSGRGRSKGVFRLKISDSTDPLYYDAVNTTTHAVVATFYITAKPSATTATVGGYTVGDVTALNVAGLLIVESGSYNKEMVGVGGHISDASRIYQGADTSVDEFLKNPSVDGGNAAVTPSAVHAAKQILMTRANAEEGDFSFICHLTPSNYETLAKFGYTLRQYNAEKGQANTTFGLPTVYKDGDTLFVPDADYEDAYIDFREKSTFFEYVQKEFGLKTTGSEGGRHEWVGTNQVGSTNSYENYNEACNIVWDGRGKDGDREGGGSPNTSVFIKNLAIPTVNQADNGV